MPETIYHNNSRTIHSLCFIHVLYSLTHNAYPPYTLIRKMIIKQTRIEKVDGSPRGSTILPPELKKRISAESFVQHFMGGTEG